MFPGKSHFICLRFFTKMALFCKSPPSCRSTQTALLGLPFGRMHLSTAPARPNSTKTPPMILIYWMQFCQGDVKNAIHSAYAGASRAEDSRLH